jgi:hypothetical protein
MFAFLAPAALKLFFGNALKGLWTWLSHRSFWQIVCMGLVVLILVQHFELAHARSEAARWHKQAIGLSEKLQQISDAKDQQKQVTREKIKVVTQRVHDADGKAKVIEQAPLPGQCKTPPEVLQADL